MSSSLKTKSSKKDKTKTKSKKDKTKSKKVVDKKSKKDKSNKKTKSKKDKSTSEVVEAPPVVVEPSSVVEAVPDVVEDAPDVVEESSVKKTRKRRVVDRDSVLNNFDSLLSSLEAQVIELRSAADKKLGVKYLKSIVKNLKSLKADSGRVMKVKKRAPRSKNTQSGFMKPVPISDEMVKFCKWEKDVPKSRVDVTKYICNYIKENSLQYPKDKRIILPDNKLKTLLNVSDDDKLTYYTLQKKIQPHFKKITTTV